MSEHKTFIQIGNDVTDGYSLFHRVTYSHPENECEGWQRGIMNFCDWLDAKGFLVVIVPRSARPHVRFGKFLIMLGELIATLG